MLCFSLLITNCKKLINDTVVSTMATTPGYSCESLKENVDIDK